MAYIEAERSVRFRGLAGMQLFGELEANTGECAGGTLAAALMERRKAVRRIGYRAGGVPEQRRKCGGDRRALRRVVSPRMSSRREFLRRAAGSAGLPMLSARAAKTAPINSRDEALLDDLS